MKTTNRPILGLLAAMLLGIAGAVAFAQDDIDQYRSCAGCGMSRKAYGYSRMLIRYGDGETVGLCSLHCAVVALDAAPGKPVKSLLVADRETRTLIDAETATWVLGGRKPGVMTRTPKWAFGTRAAAESFVKANGGEIVPWTRALEAARAELAPPPSAGKVDYRPLPKPGEKVPLGEGHYFIYGFDKPPRIGTYVMRVEIFTREGTRDTSFVVKGDSDMPSMRGAHSTGEKEFSLSAKGVYLLPVRVVMPGDWEVRFVFVKDGKTVLRGAYLFDV